MTPFTNTPLDLANPWVIPSRPKQVYFDCGVCRKEVEVGFPQEFETDRNINTEICGNEPINITHMQTEKKDIYTLAKKISNNYF